MAKCLVIVVTIEKYSFSDSKSLGIGESLRNTPTLLNVAAQDWFFADGAKDSLWAQALSSIENPAEQNFTRVETIRLISSDQSYRKLYQNVFNEELPTPEVLDYFPVKTGPNADLDGLISWKKLSKLERQRINSLFSKVGKVIAAYVSIFKSKPTRFDEFAEELSKQIESTKLNASEQRGLRLFMSKESGCSSCHSGPLFSNKTFQNIATGIPGKDNGRSEVIETLIRDEFNCLGPYSDAKPEQCVELSYINRDKHQLTGAYKTTTLRGIKYSSPYMHDGRFDQLSEVLKHYISTSNQKGIKSDLSPISLDEEQQTDIINFLLTL